MTLIQLWLLFILGTQIVHFLGTWKLYVKASRKAWEAAIPVYNAIVLMQIIKRPKWWVILLFIPIINLLMFPIIWIETIRSFGKNSRFKNKISHESVWTTHYSSFGFTKFFLNINGREKLKQISFLLCACVGGIFWWITLRVVSVLVYTSSIVRPSCAILLSGNVLNKRIHTKG